MWRPVRPLGTRKHDSKTQPLKLGGVRGVWKPLVRLTISLVLLFVILRSAEVQKILDTLIAIDGSFVALAIGIVLVIRIVMAWKWQLLLHYGGIVLGFGYLLRTILISSFMGFFLPSGLGVDIIRTVVVGRHTGYAVAAVSTIADRVVAVVTMALWSLMAALMALRALSDSQHMLTTIVVLCLALLAVTALVLSNAAMSMLRRLTAGSTILGSETSRYRRALERAKAKAVEIHDALRKLLANPFAFSSAVLLNALVQFLRILLFYFLFLAAGLEVDFIYHVIFAPIIMFVTLLPLSFLGLGVKEAAFVLLYGQVGVDPASALAISLWTYLVSIPPLAIGGVLFMFGTNQPKERERHR